MKLIIFDLDQTLVNFIVAHDKTTQTLFKQFFGIDARLTEIDFAGRSLIENFVQLGKRRGIPEEKIRDNSKQLLKQYDQNFVKNIPANASEYVLPGVKRLLDELSKTDNLIVLYTGDSPDVARAMLSATNLQKYFRFYQYGTEVKTRADMVKIATDKAGKMTGNKFEKRDIVIIGDSIRDVECGKQFGALTIAVTTGFHTREELLKAGADFIFKDLTDYRAILAAIMPS